jgi:hypothetical protein
MHIRMTLSGRALGVTGGDVPYVAALPVRVIIFWDMTGDTGLAAPKLSEILQPDASAGADKKWVQNAYAFRALGDAALSTRFKVLKDKIFLINNQDYTNPQVPFLKRLSFDFKMRHAVEYSAASGNVANKGAIYYFVLCQDPEITEATPFFDVNWRMKWVDKLF